MQASDKILARKQLERQIIEEGTAIWRSKKEMDFLTETEEKKYQWEMLATYNPWGKPGNGAPMPGALRKTKWITTGTNDNINENSVIKLGRPGHGAPLRTPTGKPQTFIKSDPLLRFQKHDLAKKAVENRLRYRSTPHDKENYRKELDEIILQKKKKGEESAPSRSQKGWTNDEVIKKMEKYPVSEREQMYEITGGGVELVPLLAKHRLVPRCPLSSTDVTRISRVCNELPKPGSTALEYFQQLCSQIDEREKRKQRNEIEDVVKSQKHFETWKGFWGRPGHGAPRALSQREKLEVLLYHIPPRRIISCKLKKQ